jgi:hypothetical protein
MQTTTTVTQIKNCDPHQEPWLTSRTVSPGLQVPSDTWRLASYLLVRFCDDGPRGQFGRSEQIYEQAILRRHLAGNHLTFVRTIAACTHPHLHPHARAHLACVLVCFIVARTRIYCIYMSHVSCRYASWHHWQWSCILLSHIWVMSLIDMRHDITDNDPAHYSHIYESCLL